MRRRIHIILIGVTIGVLLLIISENFGVNLSIVYTVAIAIIIVMMGINYVLYGKYLRKMQKLMKFFNEGSYEEYVKGMEECLVESDNFRNKKVPDIIRINLSAGYSELLQYKKALETLEPIKVDSLNKAFKIVYDINMCNFKFMLKETNEAIEIYEKNREEFQKNSNSPHYGGSIAILDTLYMYKKGEKQNALEHLKKAKENFENPRLKKHFDTVETWILSGDKTF